MKFKLYLFPLAVLCQFIIFGQTIDQQNSPEESSTLGTNYPNAGGQSFTAGLTGTLTQIDLKIVSNDFASTVQGFDLIIYEGNGYSGNVLNTTETYFPLSFGPNQISFTLANSGIAITTGTMYTLRLIMLENFDMDTSITSPGTSYPNGGLYFQEGSTGFYNLGDMWFITYVTTGPDAPTASAQSVCSGSIVADLQATGTDLKWYTAETDGTALANTTELSSATYYVSQTVNGTESDRTSVSVTVSSAITVTAMSTNVSCNGDNDGSITATVSGGTAPYIYFWSNGETTASISNLPSGTYNLLSIIDDNGCELGGGFGDTSALSVTISEPAFLNAPTAEAQAFCGLSTVADLAPESSSTIIWYNVATEGSALESTTELTTGTYYVSEANANGCESERTSVSVTINEAPTVTIEAETASFCAQEDATITAIATESATSSDFQGGYTPSNWSSSTFLSDGFVDETNAPSSIQIWGGNTGSGNLGDTEYTIQCILETTISFSWNYASGGSASDDYPLVRISGAPTLFNGFDQNGSSSQSGTMTITVPANSYFAFTMRTLTNQNGGANVTVSNFVAATSTNLSSYSWAATDGGTISGSTTNALITAETSGVYTVTTIGSNGCEATDSVDVTIVEAPNAPTATTEITYEIGDTANALTATTGGTGLLWYTTETGGIGDVNPPTPSTDTIGTTSYWVTSTNANGCESERVEIVVNIQDTLGLQEVEVLKNIRMYPNPTNGHVSISFPNSLESKITVYDLNGRLLLNKTETTTKSIIDLSNYEDGVYLLKIEVNHNELIKRVIKY